MGSESFCPMLNLLHTDMMKIIRECLLEGTESTKPIRIELYELNVCSAQLIFIHLRSEFDTMLQSRWRVVR
jgi:hypothetical protein